MWQAAAAASTTSPTEHACLLIAARRGEPGGGRRRLRPGVCAAGAPPEAAAPPAPRQPSPRAAPPATAPTAAGRIGPPARPAPPPTARSPPRRRTPPQASASRPLQSPRRKPRPHVSAGWQGSGRLPACSQASATAPLAGIAAQSPGDCQPPSSAQTPTECAGWQCRQASGAAAALALPSADATRQHDSRSAGRLAPSWRQQSGSGSPVRRLEQWR
mmetsp:Transcript_48824/g.97762  ORF Transcript_48824/g.97762 Transcript_48824/m.97762 type:complete len:216 (+) Transcript_48824:156-803(+)